MNQQTKQALDQWITKQPESKTGNGSYHSEILNREVEFWFDGTRIEPDLSEDEAREHEADIIREIEGFYRNGCGFGY